MSHEVIYVYRCDRCGASYTQEGSLRTIAVRGFSLDDYAEMDLCERCFDEFFDFMLRATDGE